MAAKPKRLVQVGLLGESPNDTTALAVLLHKRYAGRIETFPLLKNLTGSKIGGLKALRMLPAQYDELQPDIVVLTRDLDALASSTEQVRQRRQEFEAINYCVEQKGILLLHIYEFEALLLAHIAPFNKRYHCNYTPPADPMRVIDPKGKLQQATRKSRQGEYQENDCAAICKLLDYAELTKNCRYFKEFDAAFAKLLATRKPLGKN